MDLCPKTLDVKINKDFKGQPQLYKNGVLQLSELFQQLIKAVGKAVSELKREQRPFRAENGVIIEMDSLVCNLPECMEDDGIKKIYRFKMNSIKSLMFNSVNYHTMQQILTCFLLLQPMQAHHSGSLHDTSWCWS